MHDVILKTEDISKSFTTVEVLHNITFDIYSGEILGIIGENILVHLVLRKKG